MSWGPCLCLPWPTTRWQMRLHVRSSPSCACRCGRRSWPCGRRQVCASLGGRVLARTVAPLTLAPVQRAMLCCAAPCEKRWRFSARCCEACARMRVRPSTCAPCCSGLLTCARACALAVFGGLLRVAETTEGAAGLFAVVVPATRFALDAALKVCCVDAPGELGSRGAPSHVPLTE
jgi:hypothetical protein